MKPKRPFRDLLTAFFGVLQASHKIVPLIVLVALAVASWALVLIILLPQSIIGFTLFLISIISLLIYATTRNFGEAALSLIIGLLTVLTVQWTPALSILFFVARIFFWLSALLLWSINIAAQTEAIYMHAASSMSNDQKEIGKLYEQLREIGDKRTPYGMLSPVERAEAIRVLTFRRVQIDFLGTALAVIDTLKTATRLEAKLTALFVADIFKILELVPISQYGDTIGLVLSALRNSPVPPEEFVKAFQLSRRLVLSKSVTPERYLQELKRNLEIGVSADEMLEVLQSQFDATY